MLFIQMQNNSIIKNPYYFSKQTKIHTSCCKVLVPFMIWHKQKPFIIAILCFGWSIPFQGPYCEESFFFFFFEGWSCGQIQLVFTHVGGHVTRLWAPSTWGHSPHTDGRLNHPRTPHRRILYFAQRKIITYFDLENRT